MWAFCEAVLASFHVGFLKAILAGAARSPGLFVRLGIVETGRFHDFRPLLPARVGGVQPLSTREDWGGGGGGATLVERICGQSRSGFGFLLYITRWEVPEGAGKHGGASRLALPRLEDCRVPQPSTLIITMNQSFGLLVPTHQP